MQESTILLQTGMLSYSSYEWFMIVTIIFLLLNKLKRDI